MKLGYLSAILPEYRFEQVVDYAAQLGLRAVELACWPVGKATRRYAGLRISMPIPMIKTQF